MISRTVGFTLLIGFAVTGCATSRQKPPPLQSYELGIWRASYRDYEAAKQSICSAEPRWLQDEISAVNGVLNRWLERTNHGFDAEWPTADMDLLVKGANTLPAVIEVHEKNLNAMQNCRFGDDRGFPAMIKWGRDYVERARARIQEAPAIREFVVAKTALELWRTERPRREIVAKNRCPDRVRAGSAQIYYAWETEDGQMRYLFCDGARVVTKAGTLEFEAPTGLSRREKRRVKARNYLQAAQNWPRGSIDIPPDLPERPDSAHAKANETNG